MRVCIVYDCLYPWTVGGAERWYRALAERLAAAGHRVTYLTLRQWGADAPRIPGVRVVAVGPRLALYAKGRRRIGPPLLFGAGVLWHLLRHGRDYDAVHGASFPYFSLLAAATTRRRGRYRLVVDWWEVWSRAYWRRYLGPAGGLLGWVVQRWCVRVRQDAFCFSRLAATRLREEGFRGSPTLLRGAWSGRVDPPTLAPPDPVILYAGRHIPEKRVPALVPALALARRTAPELRAVILGDGPERDRVRRLVAAYDLDEAVELPGFVDEATYDAALRRALCLVLPSEREGYGLVVVDAAARGTPSVVARGPDTAAPELIEEGRNGVVAPSASADDLAAAILRVHGAGTAMRLSTAVWFASNETTLRIEGSLDAVLAAYRGSR
jgi:glycosyltransferase involved in cell wall biosynthesis